MHTFSSSSAWEPKGSRGLLLLIWPQKNTEETLSFLLLTVAACHGERVWRKTSYISFSTWKMRFPFLLWHPSPEPHLFCSRKRGYPVLILPHCLTNHIRSSRTMWLRWHLHHNPSQVRVQNDAQHVTTKWIQTSSLASKTFLYSLRSMHSIWFSPNLQTLWPTDLFLYCQVHSQLQAFVKYPEPSVESILQKRIIWHSISQKAFYKTEELWKIFWKK